MTQCLNARFLSAEQSDDMNVSRIGVVAHGLMEAVRPQMTRLIPNFGVIVATLVCLSQLNAFVRQFKSGINGCAAGLAPPSGVLVALLRALLGPFEHSLCDTLATTVYR